MKLPVALPPPHLLDAHHEGFAGPYEVGWHELARMFPGLDEQVVTLQVGARHRNGEVSLPELALLAALARHLEPKRILEIGTFWGLTTSNLAAQFGGDVEIVTIDLPKGQRPLLQSDGWNARYYPMATGHLSALERPGGPRIRQVLGDTATLSSADVGAGYDFVFIDGSHALPYVANDTRLALAVASPQAVLLWHDYGRPRHWPGVTTHLHTISHERAVWPLYWVHDDGTNLDTSLVLHLHGVPVRSVES